MDAVNPVGCLIAAMLLNVSACPALGSGCCASSIEASFYEAAAGLGFSYVRYTCWVQDLATAQVDGQSFSINLSNFPEGWEKEYELQRYYEVDPLLFVLSSHEASPLQYGTWAEAREAAQAAVPDGDDIDSRKLQAGVEKLFARAAHFGINSGIYMMLNVGIRRLVVSFASSKSHEELAATVNDALYRQVLSFVVLCNQALAMTNTCTRCSKSLRIGGGPSIKLTPMQARILQSFAQDAAATIADIAAIHHLTQDTVNFHLKSIREKFKKKSASGYALSSIAKEHGLI